VPCAGSGAGRATGRGRDARSWPPGGRRPPDSGGSAGPSRSSRWRTQIARSRRRSTGAANEKDKGSVRAVGTGSRISGPFVNSTTGRLSLTTADRHLGAFSGIPALAVKAAFALQYKAFAAFGAITPQELEIRCSIHLSYGRAARNIKSVGAAHTRAAGGDADLRVADCNALGRRHWATRPTRS
jgi:hypothetical protein